MTQIYDDARKRLSLAQINWPAIDIVVTAWIGVPDFVKEDIDVSSIITRGLAIRVGDSLPVNNASVAGDGSCATDVVVISGVPIGPPVVWFTLAERNVNPAQHRLILSVADAVNLPFDPNGLDLLIQPDWLTKRGWYQA